MVSTHEDLPFVIKSTARNVLMHYPGAINCLGFLRALRMLEDERRVDLGPDEWDYVDLRLQYSRIQNGDQITVVAYGVVSMIEPVYFQPTHRMQFRTRSPRSSSLSPSRRLGN